MRARIKAENPLVVSITDVGNCTIALDTTKVSPPADLTITTTIALAQDATSGTTRITASGTAITGLDSGDFTIGAQTASDFLCIIGGFVLSGSTLEGFLASPIEDAINGALCKSCAGGTLAECGSSFATACTGNVCEEGSQCLQELGLDGRAIGSLLLGSLSPGTTGALDLYEVAGGYALTDKRRSGISLGLLGGMEPGGTATRHVRSARDRAAGGLRPGLDLLHGQRPSRYQRDVRRRHRHPQVAARAQLAYAGYEGGLFCLTIGSNTTSQLTTDTISLLSRSLGHLVEKNSPMAVGLRPQSPPTITLGNNTFMTDGMGNRTLVDALLDIRFQAMELDFFAEVDRQYIRVFTLVTDVHLPVGLDIGAGTLTPVLGDVADAFTNVSVKNSDAVTESPAELASLFPTLLNLVLPQLSGGLPTLTLPALGGLDLSVTDITAVDDHDNDGVGDFLAIYANLVPAAMAHLAVHTTFDIASIEEPADAIARDPGQWRNARPPTVTLSLGSSVRDSEWQLRIDDGMWTPWSTNAHPVLAPRVFWLPGLHHVEVRAREKGHPESADPTPAVIDIPLGQSVLAQNGGAKSASGVEAAGLADPFHGQSGAAGCTCDGGGGGFGNAAPFALVIAFVLLPLRRLRRATRGLVRQAVRLGPLVWLAAIACLPGCSCGSKPCGDADCMAGTLKGAVGKWTSIAGDDKRVMVASYDQVFGDLVIADATDQTNIQYKTVDGVPQETPTYDPSTWRGGISDPGPNVGAWTSIVLANHTARVAYQDRDATALKYAFEGDHWTDYVIDAGHGEAVGEFASMVLDANKQPAIAYLAVGNDDGMGHRVTQLRLARAANADPASTSDWAETVIASGTGTCAGLCGAQSCLAGATATDPQICVTPTSDCTAACATGDVCSAATCQTVIVDPQLDDIPTGTGLFVSLVLLPDGRLAAAYYDRNKRALTLGVESASGTSMFAETVLDGNAAGADTGMWSSAVVAGDGTVHIAYQEALGDQLMYTTWANGTPGTPVVVDDGERAGDRTHPVGAAATIFLVNGSPAIAYQDGLTADVYLATQSGTTWTTNGIATGPLLDGFSIAATTGHGTPVLAWDSLTSASSPPNGLVVKSP